MGDDDQQGAAAPEPARAAQADQTWLVQRTETIDLEPDDVRTVWVDVGRVTVPPRTKRRTIVQHALENWPEATPAKTEQARFRVLDGDSAEEIPVRWDVPPAPEPELRIG